MVALTVISIIYIIYKLIKEALEPTAPPIDNFDLYRKDILSGADSKTLYKNQLNGKYS